MEQIETLINARWIIPVEPAGVVLEHHALAIRGHQIIDLLPQAEAQRRYQAQTVHSLTEHALIPGLINSHTHLGMSLLRGYADDMPLMRWLTEHIWPAEERHASTDFVRDGSLLGLAELLRGGVTCVNDMYFFPEITAAAATQLRMRATVGAPLISFPSAYARTPEEYVEKGLALHDAYQNHPLIRTAFAPHAPYTVSDSQLARVRVLADELDIPIHMHIHETADEVERSVAETGMRPLARLHKLGLLSPALIGVHFTQLTEDEIELLAATGVHAVHCPHSNLKLASGFCPVAALHAAGVNLAIGTDSAASNNSLDMFSELRTTALLAKAVAGDAAAIPAQTALELATINGARALGLADQIGSLLPGKDADITAVQLDNIENEPLYDPISQLVYASSRQQVSDVWIAGRRLLASRHITSLNIEQLIGKARHWRGKIAESLSASSDATEVSP